VREFAEFDVRSLWALGALSALLIIGPGAAGASECQASFERWSKLSQTRVRVQPWTTASGLPIVGDKRPPSQACAPGETTRQELLKALARVRAKCDELPSDPVAPATKTMLDINEGFLRSLPLCRIEGASVGAPKPPPSPAPQQPAPPTPAPPQAAAPAAAPVVASVPPPPIAQPQGAARRCLHVTRIAPERYALSNRWCSGNTVLAIVETRGAQGEVECRAHAIGQSMSVRSLGNAPPHINHECLWSQGNCTKEHLDGMFPECDW
jgi:hypothetical protein